MLALTIILPVSVLLLAFANGANDNAKGVATLIGSRTMGQRPALVFAAATTLLGSLAAIFLAGVLIDRFSGNGMVGAELAGSPAFAACVASAAAVTVLLATRIGMPVSTTHAIVGAIVGVGLAAGDLLWGAAVTKFLIPLLASPLLAMVLVVGVYGALRRWRLHLGLTQQTCICVDRKYVPVTVSADGVAAMTAAGVVLHRDEVATCRQAYAGRVVGVEAQRVLDVSHVLTAGVLSFARGLNDTPKIAALLIAAGAAAPQGALTGVGLGIVLGGLLAVRRVARTMSNGITGMNDGQGFSANLVTAALVLLATLKFGVPVSTTHTSCGSLFGIGMVNGQAHWHVVGRILFAWAATLPVAAGLGCLAWRMLGA